MNGSENYLRSFHQYMHCNEMKTEGLKCMSVHKSSSQYQVLKHGYFFANALEKRKPVDIIYIKTRSALAITILLS